jgi:hypothetical protein
MLDIMFDLPDQPRGTRYTITDGVVNGTEKLFSETSSVEGPQTKSA